MTDEKPTQELHPESGKPVRDARGRLLHGRPKGIIEKRPRNMEKPISKRLSRASVRENLELIEEVARTNLKDALACLAESAKTDPASAEKFIRLVSPQPPPRVFVRGAAHISHLPAEDRLAAISAMVARGEMDCAAADYLSRLVRAEIEFRYVRPLKLAVRDLELALKSGDRKSAEDAILKLARELDVAHVRTVEGEVADG